MQGCAFPAYAVRFIRKRMYAAGIDPPIIEIEQGADRDRQIDGIVIPTGGVKWLHIFRRNSRRVVIHLMHETKQSFMLFVQPRGL